MIIERKTEYYHVGLVIKDESKDCGQSWISISLQNYDNKAKILDSVGLSLQREQIEQLKKLCEQALRVCNNL